MGRAGDPALAPMQSRQVEIKIELFGFLVLFPDRALPFFPRQRARRSGSTSIQAFIDSSQSLAPMRPQSARREIGLAAIRASHKFLFHIAPVAMSGSELCKRFLSSWIFVSLAWRMSAAGLCAWS